MRPNVPDRRRRRCQLRSRRAIAVAPPSRRRRGNVKATVLNLDADGTSEIELKDSIFGLEPRTDLIQRVVVWQLAKRRAGTHKVLTRGEINITKKNLYRQKGTGQARHGARSAPLFVGGAKAMGPVQHSHAFDLPKKVRALGLRHALSAKAKDGTLIVIESAKSQGIKTKDLAKRLGRIGIGNALIVDGELDGNFALSARNLSSIGLLPTAGLNVYDILRREKLVLTTAAVKAIEERLS